MLYILLALSFFSDRSHESLTTSSSITMHFRLRDCGRLRFDVPLVYFDEELVNNVPDVHHEFKSRCALVNHPTFVTFQATASREPRLIVKLLNLGNVLQRLILSYFLLNVVGRLYVKSI